MGLLDYITRTLLMLAGASIGFAVINFASMGYKEMAFLFLITMMIPVSMVVYEYMTVRKK